MREKMSSQKTEGAFVHERILDTFTVLKKSWAPIVCGAEVAVMGLIHCSALNVWVRKILATHCLAL